MQDPLAPVSIIESTSNNSAREVVISYWPWMRMMRLLDQTRLEELPWEEARYGWIFDPQPYEYLVPRAPASAVLLPPAAQNTISSTLSSPTSVKYNTNAAPLNKWPWEHEMRMREQLRLRRKNVTWADVRQKWLTEPEAYECTPSPNPISKTTPGGKTYAAHFPL